MQHRTSKVHVVTAWRCTHRRGARVLVAISRADTHAGFQLGSAGPARAATAISQAGAAQSVRHALFQTGAVAP
jgi:hypothetical protein